MSRLHPSDETLMRYAAATLGAGPRLVLGIHLDGCPHCRERLRTFETLGGALLEAQAPAPVSPVLLEKIFARIDAGEAQASRVALEAPKRAPTLANGYALPARLAGHEIGPWRFIHPGLRWSRVRIADAPDEKIIMLKFAAGLTAPSHSHGGLELTQVLYGSFSDAGGTYEPGDLIEADEHVEHQPHVSAEGECLCIAALEAPLRFQTLIGRLFQPLMGI